MNTLDEVIPYKVQMDPWLVFHGTSNIYQESIGKNGLCPSTSNFDLSELKQVETIFEKLHWAGIHPWGFAVLQPFSISHDHGNEDGKPIYLAESAQRASVYANSDFAGGEICRALYYCIEDLYKYLENENVREEHALRLEMRFGLERIDRTSIPPLSWVQNQVGKLSEIQDRVSEIRQSFSYGVIYAIRLDKDNLNDIEYNNAIGIKSFRPISKSENEAEYKLPTDIKNVLGQDKKRLKSFFEPGIVKTIRDREPI